MAGITVGLIALPLALALGIASIPVGTQTPFGAAEKMEDAMQRIGTLPRVLILRLHLVSAMNATALNALESIVERMQHGRGVVILSGLHRQPLEMLRKAGFVEVVGRKNFCATFDNALLRANQVLAESGDS